MRVISRLDSRLRRNDEPKTTLLIVADPDSDHGVAVDSYRVLLSALLELSASEQLGGEQRCASPSLNVGIAFFS